MENNVKAFKKELAELMKKYGVRITASDEWQGYSECGEDIQILIETSEYPYEEEKFGTSIDVEDLIERN